MNNFINEYFKFRNEKSIEYREASNICYILLCNRCSNKVFASAMKKFFELKGEVTI